MTIGWGKTFAVSYPKPPPRNLNIKSGMKTGKYSFFSISSGAMLKLLFINIQRNAVRDHLHRPHYQVIWYPYFPTLFFKAKAMGQTKVMGKLMRTELKIMG